MTLGFPVPVLILGSRFSPGGWVLWIRRAMSEDDIPNGGEKGPIIDSLCALFLLRDSLARYVYWNPRRV
jgi:hypothetical protein